MNALQERSIVQKAEVHTNERESQLTAVYTVRLERTRRKCAGSTPQVKQSLAMGFCN